MTQLFPDVAAGDRITGVHRPWRGRALLLQRQVARRGARDRLRAPLLRHLAVTADLGAETAPGPARRPAGGLMTGAANVVSLPTPAPALAGAWRGGSRYGALGLPLAFVALPLYVVLPNHYAGALGVPLALLGVVLLAARLLDAIADPLIGRWADRLFARSSAQAPGGPRPAPAWCWRSASPRCSSRRCKARTALLVWCAALLAVTYLGYSVVTVIHQAWGARLGGDEAQRARIVAWREGLALAGVLVASVLPSLAGLGVTSVGVRGCLLAVGLLLLRGAPQPRTCASRSTVVRRRPPFANPAFRQLLAIYLRQRHRERGAGHAGAVLHPRPPAGAAVRAAVSRQLLRGRRAVDSAVGARRRALRPGAHLARRHAAGHRRRSSGPRRWAPATWRPSPPCACSAAWRSAPT